MFGSLEEGATAFIVIFLLVVAEVGTEWRAKRALAALKLSTPRDAVVKREGQLQTIPASDVVPGDIVQLIVGMVCGSVPFCPPLLLQFWHLPSKFFTETLTSLQQEFLFTGGACRCAYLAVAVS